MYYTCRILYAEMERSYEKWQTARLCRCEGFHIFLCVHRERVCGMITVTGPCPWGLSLPGRPPEPSRPRMHPDGLFEKAARLAQDGGHGPAVGRE